MPNEQDVVGTSSESTQTISNTKKTKTLNEVISQPLEKITYNDKSGEYTVHTFHPHKFTKDYIEGLLDFSKKLKKEIYVIDWANSNSPIFCKKEMQSNPKAYFLLIPNPEMFEFFDKGVVYHLYFSNLAGSFQFASQLNKEYNDQEEIFQDTTTSPSNRLYDGNSEVIAEVCQTFTKFRFDWTLKNSTDELSIALRKAAFTHLIKGVHYIMNSVLGPKQDDMNVDEIKYQVENYNNFFVNSLIKVQKSLEVKLKDNLNQLLEQQKALFRYEKTIQEINDNLKGATARINDKITIEKSKDQLEKVFTTIFKEKFKSIYYSSDYIRVKTKMIYIDFIKPQCDGGDGVTSHRYQIGEFDIYVYLNGQIKLVNTTNPMGNYDHPHVSNNIPCLGNLAQAIPKMIAEGDYIEVILVMYDYLKTINRTGWYGSGNIYRWPTVKSRINQESIKIEQEPHCTHCGALSSDDCECEFCEHCDRLVDVCEEEPCSTREREREIAEAEEEAE